jgi:very-short-patch-repair endonuclease
MKELDKTMYFKASPRTLETARLLRNHMNYYEKLLWERLKGKQLNGIRFRPQHPIDIFIADFYCHKARLVIELDGEIHKKQKDYDIGRSAELERYGIEVIRFLNNEVEKDMENVLTKIKMTIEKRLTSF